MYQIKDVVDSDKKFVGKALSFIKGFKKATSLELGYKKIKQSTTEISVENINSSRSEIKAQVEKIRKLYLKQGLSVQFETILNYKSGWKPSKITDVDVI